MTQCVTILLIILAMSALINIIVVLCINIVYIQYVFGNRFTQWKINQQSLVYILNNYYKSGNCYRHWMMLCFHGSTSYMNSATSQFLKMLKLKYASLSQSVFKQRRGKGTKQKIQLCGSRRDNTTPWGTHKWFWSALSRYLRKWRGRQQWDAKAYHISCIDPKGRHLEQKCDIATCWQVIRRIWTGDN